MSTQYQVDYDPTIVFNTTDLISSMYNIVSDFQMDSAENIVDAFVTEFQFEPESIPNRFIDLSGSSKAFREAITARLLERVETLEDREKLLNMVTRWVASSTDNSSNLRIFSEYAAAITFALEHTDVAVKIIKRNKPEAVSRSIWSIVDAIKKGMPGVMYQGYVLSNKPLALTQFEGEKHQYAHWF